MDVSSVSWRNKIMSQGYMVESKERKMPKRPIEFTRLHNVNSSTIVLNGLLLITIKISSSS